MKTTTHKNSGTCLNRTYTIAQRYALFFWLFSFSFTLSSCTTLLDLLWPDYNTCSVPGCGRKSKKTAIYCAHHDHDITKQSLDNSLEKVRKQYGGKP